MNELLNSLLGLRDVAFGAGDVAIQFARPLPAWLWVGLAGATVTLALVSYRRLPGSRAGRIGLGLLRAATVLLLALIISGPQLVRPNERIERDWLLALVDRSASMTVADVAGPDGGRVAREAQLQRAIGDRWELWRMLAADKEVVWLGFDAGAFDLRTVEADGDLAGVDLGAPRGLRTNLGAALDEALRRAAARPLSAVVIFSDGRSLDEPSRAALRRLEAEHAPVFVVPLGSADPVADVAIGQITAPAQAFAGDIVPVTVELERIGEGRITGLVRLVDTATGLTLTTEELTAEDWDEGGVARITLVTTPDEPGARRWQVVVEPDQPDLIADNNTGEALVDALDRPLRVVYFDGYPRWERRYVTWLLDREALIDTSSLMLAPARRYIEEGDTTIGAPPRTSEGWEPFDVVILGDLRADLFSTEQLAQLREHIASRGAGLVWIAGPGATPQSWRGTPMEDLLPFTMEGGPPEPYREPVTMRPTPLAERSGLLQLGADGGWPAELSDPATGWSALRWAQRIDSDQLKPAAEALALATPISEGGSLSPETLTGDPIVISMQYGAGRIFYIATDEIWRWRYARGEALPEKFWLPLVRLQGRQRLARSAHPAMLEVRPRRAVTDQPVRISVRLHEQSLVDLRLGSISARIRRFGETAGGESVALAPEDAGALRGVSQEYAASWVPTEPGEWEIVIDEPALAMMDLRQRIEVRLPDDELRRPEADHALLTSLAEATGGRAFTAAELGELPPLLPSRDVIISGAPDVETLWDKPAVLALLLMLLTAEWVGRRLLRLV
ncbi:MAG: hypothetical protein ACF8R7_03910 [Phycisphaerales bacterium JB039]